MKVSIIFVLIAIKSLEVYANAAEPIRLMRDKRESSLLTNLGEHDSGLIESIKADEKELVSEFAGDKSHSIQRRGFFGKLFKASVPILGAVGANMLANRYPPGYMPPPIPGQPMAPPPPYVQPPPPPPPPPPPNMQRPPPNMQQPPPYMQQPPPNMQQPPPNMQQPPPYMQQPPPYMQQPPPNMQQPPPYMQQPPPCMQQPPPCMQQPPRMQMRQQAPNQNSQQYNDDYSQDSSQMAGGDYQQGSGSYSQEGGYPMNLPEPYQQPYFQQGF